MHRHLAVLIVCLLFGLLSAAAQASTGTVSDAQGDVLACTGECNQNGEDLQSVTIDDGGGNLTFTIRQYDGDFTNMCTCFYPQVQIYTGSTDPSAPDFYTATWNTGSNYAGSGVGLFDYSQSQQNPCSAGGYGGAYGDGWLTDVNPVAADAHTLTLSFPAGLISDGRFSWRVVEPADSRCQIQGNPETAPRDVAPDSGLSSWEIGASSGGGGTTTQPATAPLPPIPTGVVFRQLLGIRLGMTVPQARKAISDKGCPMLTARTRRFRSRYGCWFTTAALPPGADTHESELIWGSNARRCGADATLRFGRVLDLSTMCKVKLAGGAGVGSSFKAMSALFKKGTVRCHRGGQFQHECYAQQRSGRAIYFTEFDDGKPIDRKPALVVADLMVGRCAKVASELNWRHSFQICDPRFTLGHVRGEFTP